MAASWTRTAVSLGAPLVAAVAVAVAVSGRGCADDAAGSPESVVGQFIEAAKQMDREAMFAMLGPRTRERLSDAALRATDLSPRRYAAADMIGFNTGLDDLAVDELAVRVVSRDGDRASVELRDRRGRLHRLELVSVDGEWRIELAPAQ
jgi:hypothetical protein